MKKINGKITFLVNRDKTTIQIDDADASTTFVTVELTPEQLSSALSRLAYTDCECYVYNLDRVGKKHENDSFVFEIEEKDKRDKDKLKELCLIELKKQGMSEWIPDNNYSSQNSFFKKDDKFYARAIIRRWV